MVFPEISEGSEAGVYKWLPRSGDTAVIIAYGRHKDKSVRKPETEQSAGTGSFIMNLKIFRKILKEREDTRIFPVI